MAPPSTDIRTCRVNFMEYPCDKCNATDLISFAWIGCRWAADCFTNYFRVCENTSGDVPFWNSSEDGKIAIATIESLPGFSFAFRWPRLPRKDFPHPQRKRS